MPDNKSLQQQAEEFAFNVCDHAHKVQGTREYRELKESLIYTYLAASTKYISEIEERDKKIEELQKQNLELAYVRDGLVKIAEQLIRFLESRNSITPSKEKGRVI